jgi:hypothetical protein
MVTNPVGLGSYQMAGSLPQIVSNTDMLMLPYLINYSNQVAALNNYTDTVNGNMPLFTMAQAAAVTGTNTGNNNNNNGTSNNYEDYYQKLAEQQARMSQYNIQQNMRYRQEQLAANAPFEKIAAATQVLQGKIAQNEQDQIPGALAAFYESIKEAYDPEGTADEATIKARALGVYQSQTGRNLIADIKACGNSSIVQGFLNGLAFGIFGQNTTAEENIAQITDQPVSSSEKNMQKVGETTGYAATGALMGAGVGAFFGGIGAGPGALVGAGVGAVYGLIKSFF